jgi:hypothetical protein
MNHHSIRVMMTTIMLFLLIGIVSAEVLVNTTLDKDSISTNELARTTITFYNNGLDIEKYPIKIETSENLVIIENEQNVLFDVIDEIKENRIKELNILFKATNTKEDIGKIFVYHGNNLQFVAGTFIGTEELPVKINSSFKKSSASEGEKIIFKIEMKNNGEPINNVGIELIAPNGFIIKTTSFFKERLNTNEKIEQEFEVIAPLEARDEHKFKLAYGFFSEKGAHYFEESFTIEFEKNNNLLLAVIGIIVLIIAVFFYIKKSETKQTDVKGTGE